MVTEARLERLVSGLAPVTPGWFVVNTADAAWTNNEAYGGVCIFESDHVVLQGRPDLTEYEKPDAGFTIRVVPPGQPSGGYHAESVQEDFLVLMGECVLIIEDQERHMRAWDFVDWPPMTAHAFVAKGTGQCVILATGNRRDDSELVEPRSEVASATARDPSAEGNGWSSVPNAGTSFRGLNGPSARACAAAFERNAAAHYRWRPSPGPASGNVP